MSYGALRPTVVKVLLGALRMDDIEIIAAMLGGSIDDVTAPSATRKKRVVDLILWAETGGLEEELIRNAMEQSETNKQLKLVGPTLLQALRASKPSAAPWYTPPAPVLTCIVGSDQAFVDRSELRTSLQQLMPANGWRALVVHGEERSGRSFTHELIAFVVGLSDEARIAHVDLSTSSPDLGPGDLVRRIALQLTLDNQTLPPQQEQAPRWNDELRDWLVGQVEASQRTCWLVIDAIDKVRPSDATMDIIWKLATAARTRPRLRVVLLGCSEPPPDEVKALRELIEPINAEKVEEFFGVFLQHKGLPPDDELVQKATTTALANVPAAGADRLECLQREVAKVARGIAEGRI